MKTPEVQPNDPVSGLCGLLIVLLCIPLAIPKKTGLFLAMMSQHPLILATLQNPNRSLAAPRNPKQPHIHSSLNPRSTLRSEPRIPQALDPSLRSKVDSRHWQETSPSAPGKASPDATVALRALWDYGATLGVERLTFTTVLCAGVAAAASDGELGPRRRWELGEGRGIL